MVRRKAKSEDFDNKERKSGDRTFFQRALGGSLDREQVHSIRQKHSLVSAIKSSFRRKPRKEFSRSNSHDSNSHDGSFLTKTEVRNQPAQPHRRRSSELDSLDLASGSLNLSSNKFLTICSHERSFRMHERGPNKRPSRKRSSLLDISDSETNQFDLNGSGSMKSSTSALESFHEGADELDERLAKFNPPRLFNISNHVMVNHERIGKHLPLLVRSHELDEIAKSHAKEMAEKDLVFHCDLDKVKESINCDGVQIFGDNVAEGPSVEEIHCAMMEIEEYRCNILNHDFKEMGMAVEHNIHGKLFLCQIYRDVVLSSSCPEDPSSSSTDTLRGSLTLSRMADMYFV